MLPVWVFDDGLQTLAPLTDLRPAFDVRTGALTNLERLTRQLETRPALLVPAPLADLTREAHPGSEINATPAPTGHLLAINGRWCGPFGDEIRTLKLGEALLDHGTGAVLAASVAGKELHRIAAGDTSG